MRRCITSYATDFRRHDRNFELLVVDDSTAAATREACRQWLAVFARKFQVDVCYAGREEREKFIEQLVRRCGISPEPIRFALTNSLGIPASPGANRNTLLLHTVGDIVLSCDDDSVCHIGELRHGNQSVRIVPFGNANMDVHFVASRRAAMSGVRRANRDLMTAHEELLGRTLDELVPHVPVETAATLGSADAATRQARVAVTLSGVLGDSGVPNLMGFVFSRGPIRERFLDYWRLTQSSKSPNVITGVPSPVISQKSYIMTLATGLDNRSLLPPFVPSGRGEDSSFGATMHECLKNLYTGFVPVAVLHARQSSSVSEAVCDPPRLSDTLISAIHTFPDLDSVVGPDRLKHLGMYLIECGIACPADFKEFLKGIALRRIAALSGIGEYLLREFQSKPEFWAREIRQALARLRQQLSQPDLGLPTDLPAGDSDSRYAAFQRFIRNFGELMQAWPDIVAATLFLRNSGHTIGRQIQQ